MPDFEVNIMNSHVMKSCSCNHLGRSFHMKKKYRSSQKKMKTDLLTCYNGKYGYDIHSDSAFPQRASHSVNCFCAISSWSIIRESLSSIPKKRTTVPLKYTCISFNQNIQCLLLQQQKILLKSQWYWVCWSQIILARILATRKEIKIILFNASVFSEFFNSSSNSLI